jgi:hypothetical protein
MILKMLSDFESEELGVFEKGERYDLPPELAVAWIGRLVAELS